MSWRKSGVGVVALVGCVLLAGGGTAAADDAGTTTAVNPPLLLGATRLDVTCVGTGANAAAALTLRYALTAPARVTFTIQRRTAPGLATPSRCPRPLAPTNASVTYADVGATGVDATAGPGSVTVQQPGTVTAGPPAPGAGGTPVAATRRQTVTRTVSATRGTHRIALLRAAQSLAPGRYRILIQATDTTGTSSGPRIVWFWVLRGG